MLQGLGLGGLQALVQIAMAAMISPRERGRYSGLIGAVMAVATVGGPLIGGLLVDTSWLGWRWCFYVGVPFAVVALVLLQRTLHLPVTERDVRIDYLGAAFLTAGVSALLIWVTLAGDTFAWISLETLLMVGGGVLAVVAFVVTEMRAKEPIVPLRLFRDRTTTLAIIASVAVGVALFGSTVPAIAHETADPAEVAVLVSPARAADVPEAEDPDVIQELLCKAFPRACPKKR